MGLCLFSVFIAWKKTKVFWKIRTNTENDSFVEHQQKWWFLVKNTETNYFGADFTMQILILQVSSWASSHYCANIQVYQASSWTTWHLCAQVQHSQASLWTIKEWSLGTDPDLSTNLIDQYPNVEGISMEGLILFICFIDYCWTSIG